MYRSKLIKGLNFVSVAWQIFHAILVRVILAMAEEDAEFIVPRMLASNRLFNMEKLIFFKLSKLFEDIDRSSLKIW